MTRRLAVNRKTIMAACGVLISLTAIVVALNIKSVNQRVRDSAREDALKQMNETPDQSLRVVGNDDCPLRIIEAKVKDVPGALFTKLTGRTTALVTISSTPG